MPLKLIPPAKAPGGVSYYIHGTHLGVSVRRSARTDRRPLATAELKRIEREIEQGRYAEPAPPPPKSFADAALGYLKDCPESEVGRVNRLLEYFQTVPLSGFNKDKIDEGEEHFYPGRRLKFAAGTLNREYRAPLAAVLHHAAGRELMPWIEIEKYPERQTTKFLEPNVALDLIAAAAVIDAGKKRHKDARLAPLLMLLFTTGLRISEACKIDWPLVNLERREIGPLRTKNGEEYVIHLGDLAFEAIANLPGPRVARRKIFGFRDRHAVKYSLGQACEIAGLVKRDAAGQVERYKVSGKNTTGRPKTTFNLHQARHSFGTWLRRQEGMDLKKMMDLGRWKDIRSVARYAHVSADEHAPAIAALPINRKMRV